MTAVEQTSIPITHASATTASGSDASTSPGAWRMMAASATGSRHARQGAANQDAFTVAEAAPGVLIAAVADGAGSAVHGGDGARIAVATAAQGLTALATALVAEPALAVDEPTLLTMLRLIFTDAQTALVRGAAGAGVPLAQLRTTLSCLLLTETLALAGQVGDGAMTLVHADGRLELALRPRRGEYANATYFLTELPALPDSLVTRVVTAPLVGCLLTSDGLLDLVFSAANTHCTPFAGFMAPLFKPLAQSAAPDATALDQKLRAFLDRPLIRDKTADDLTLILAFRAGAPLPDLFAPPPPAPPAEPVVITTATPAPAAVIALAGPAADALPSASASPTPAIPPLPTVSVMSGGEAPAEQPVRSEAEAELAAPRAAAADCVVGSEAAASPAASSLTLSDSEVDNDPADRGRADGAALDASKPPPAPQSNQERPLPDAVAGDDANGALPVTPVTLAKRTPASSQAVTATGHFPAAATTVDRPERTSRDREASGAAPDGRTTVAAFPTAEMRPTPPTVAPAASANAELSTASSEASAGLPVTNTQLPLAGVPLPAANRQLHLASAPPPAAADSTSATAASVGPTAANQPAPGASDLAPAPMMAPPSTPLAPPALLSPAAASTWPGASPRPVDPAETWPAPVVASVPAPLATGRFNGGPPARTTHGAPRLAPDPTTLRAAPSSAPATSPTPTLDVASTADSNGDPAADATTPTSAARPSRARRRSRRTDNQ